MNKYVMIIALICAMAICQVYGQDEFYGKQEATCIRKGGLCIKKSECEHLVVTDHELCPQQANQGFECCYGLPKSEKRCQRRGGECFKKGYCNQNLVYSEASDCGADQDCCILV